MSVARIFKSRRIFVTGILLLFLSPGLWVAAKLIKSPHSAAWAGAYFQDFFTGRYGKSEQTTDLFFILCDHWEPGYGKLNADSALTWLGDLRLIASEHHDSDGRGFQYTWFYPIDNRDPTVMRMLAGMVHEGFGEMEVHWHHNHDDPELFAKDLAAGLEDFRSVGALISEENGPARWCFIHGNWALDGSVPNRCGRSNEIEVFLGSGCYADFTFPAPGTAAQPATINRVYYAQDTPEAKSYDKGVLARVGEANSGLLMLPGPLALDFRNPLILIEHAAIDNAEGTGFSGRVRRPKGFRDYFKTHRVKLWDDIHVSVTGRPEWCFVKTHAHGMQHAKVLLGGELDCLLDSLEQYCLDRGIRLHYVTAREAVNLVHAAERNLHGDPAQFYDLVVPPPLNRFQASQ